MKHTKIDIICDIDKCGNYLLKQGEQPIQVIFTTNQTDGYPAKENYFSSYKLDLCDECRSHLLNGHYIMAHGAQGHNTYYFKEPRKRKHYEAK